MSIGGLLTVCMCSRSVDSESEKNPRKRESLDIDFGAHAIKHLSELPMDFPFPSVD